MLVAISWTGEETHKAGRRRSPGRREGFRLLSLCKQRAGRQTDRHGTRSFLRERLAIIGLCPGHILSGSLLEVLLVIVVVMAVVVSVAVEDGCT